MNTKLPFKLNAIAMSMSLALSGTAMAQESSDDSVAVLEEVVVQGIRKSLQRSVQVKRESSGLVDALSSESIGKFPDANIAEALQRIPGITIDRNGGEGQFVTVRGFGPSFNTVLVNGRRIASEVGNREFSFDLFPSEMISGATIHKSGTATLQEGGIGATVNLSTIRPLDEPGMKGVFVGRGLYDKNSGSTTPQVFGLLSNSFADDTIGVLGSIAYQKRDSEVLTFNNRGVNSGLISELDPSVTVTNPGNVDRFFMSQNLQLGQTLQERERLNIQGALQFQPNDDVLITLDGMWNEFDLKSESRFINTWFSISELDNLVLDENGTVLSTDQSANGGIEARAQNDSRPTKTNLLGFNVKWDQNENLSHSFDLSLTNSENKPQDADTGQSVIGFRSPYTYVNDGSTPYPFARFNISADEARDRSQYLFHVAQYGGDGDSKEAGNFVDSSLNEMRYDGVFTSDDESYTLRFGLNAGQESKDVDIRRTDQTALCTYCGFFLDVPDNLENALLFNVNNDLLSQGDGGFVDNTGAIMNTYLGNTVAGDTNALATAEVLALRDAALSLAPGTSQAEFEALGGFATQKRPESFSVEEDIFAFYIDADFNGEWGQMPYTINAGLRYVDTETTATGTNTPLVDIRRNLFDTTEYLQELGDIADAEVEQTNSYSEILPNLSLKLSLTDELTLRSSVSKTMSRPQLTDLSPRLAILNTRPNFLVAVGGNPNLEPFTSTNFDFGLEYYVGDFNYIAISAFRKDVENFIVQTTGRETLSIANADGITEDPRITGSSASFDVTRPTNAEDATVDGFEISGQYMFDFLPEPFDGIGVIGNLLFVDSNAEVGQNTNDRVNFGLTGLSNAQNAQLFYSKNNFDARISYSRREAFLETLSNVIGGEPVFVKDYEQFDLKVSYTFDSINTSVFFEGINIGDSEIEKTGRFSNQFIEQTNTGPRYAIGFSMSY